MASSKMLTIWTCLKIQKILDDLDLDPYFYFSNKNGNKLRKEYVLGNDVNKFHQIHRITLYFKSEDLPPFISNLINEINDNQIKQNNQLKEYNFKKPKFNNNIYYNYINDIQPINTENDIPTNLKKRKTIIDDESNKEMKIFENLLFTKEDILLEQESFNNFKKERYIKNLKNWKEFFMLIGFEENTAFSFNNFFCFLDVKDRKMVDGTFLEILDFNMFFVNYFTKMKRKKYLIPDNWIHLFLLMKFPRNNTLIYSKIFKKMFSSTKFILTLKESNLSEIKELEPIHKLKMLDFKNKCFST